MLDIRIDLLCYSENVVDREKAKVHCSHPQPQAGDAISLRHSEAFVLQQCCILNAPACEGDKGIIGGDD
jgi:hypothetical protein